MFVSFQLEATDDILERSAFQADESDIMTHKLVKTTESFLFKHLYGNDSNPMVAIKGKVVENTEGEGVTLLISLSGGNAASSFYFPDLNAVMFVV